jgi:hypothetical protein
MGTQPVYTDALVELYSMAKMYAEENPPVNDRQEAAILHAESLIESTTGWEITQPYERGTQQLW